MKEAPEDEERASSYSTALLPQSGSDNQGLGCGKRVLGKPSYLHLPEVKPRLKNGQSSYDKSSLTDNLRIAHQNNSEESSRFKMKA